MYNRAFVLLHRNNEKPPTLLKKHVRMEVFIFPRWSTLRVLGFRLAHGECKGRSAEVRCMCTDIGADFQDFSEVKTGFRKKGFLVGIKQALLFW